MRGLVLNVDDALLPADSPWRTREEQRAQPAVFTLDDGYPVFEVWFFRQARWWCLSKGYDLRLARQGVVYFATIEQLKRALLTGQAA